MHSEKKIWLAIPIAGLLAASPASRALAAPPVTTGGARTATVDPPGGGNRIPPSEDEAPLPGYDPPPAGARALPAGDPPGSARVHPVRQRRDREEPELLPTEEGPRPDPRIEEAPPRPALARPKTPSYVVTSTRAAQPSVQIESPDSALAASKRLDANGPAPEKSNTEELIRKARTNVDFYELVDELLDEVVYQLSKQDAMALSPLAIRMVRLSPDLRPEFAATLEARLLARIGKNTSIRTAVCIECSSMRSRVENGQWLVTLGAVRQEDLQRIARSQGIKTFVDLGFNYNPQSNVIWMEAIAFRASDGGVIWSDSYTSNATTAMLLRTGRYVPSRAERLTELEHKLQGRPFFGYMVAVGLARLGYNGPTGDIQGPLMTIRIHERFGEDQQQLFGLSVGIFFTGVPEAGKNVLNSLMSGAYYSMNLSEPSLNRPELWAYGELGGMFSGNQGNTFYGEAGLDLHLKWRFSMAGGLQYLLPTHFADHDLGGLGYRLRLALNW
jgi:hypothetical protein